MSDKKAQMTMIVGLVGIAVEGLLELARYIVESLEDDDTSARDRAAKDHRVDGAEVREQLERYKQDLEKLRR
jgi:hypothetical protein